MRRQRPPRRTPQKRVSRLRPRAGIVFAFAAAIGIGALIGLFLAYQSDLPQVSSLEDYEPNIITRVLAADGSLLGEFSIERRVVVRFEDIPPALRNAIVGVEDADFWTHLGINPWRISGALLANLREGRRAEGFSTLTMQLSRLLFLTPEKTYARKIQEIILAFQIERNFTKEEIFALYCNQIYFGHGNYGVEAASRFFFSKSIADLSLAEAALLAGIPQSPNRLSPIEHREAAAKRRNHVLGRMAAEKFISAQEAYLARLEPIALELTRSPPSIAPYFLEEVRKHLEREYGSQRIYQGGLRVHTTLDPRLQRAANRAVRDGLLKLDRIARGFVAPTRSILEGGELPDDIRLAEWAWPVRAGDVVAGVVMASHRDVAVIQIADFQASLTRADIEWTGLGRVDQVLPVGAVTLFRVLALPDAAARTRPRIALEQFPEVQGALVALDVRTGGVRAMVGGFDFRRSKFNRATQALRQVGSAFKPILYTAAIEKAGWTPITLLDDSPLRFAIAGQEDWAPRNYDRRFLGPVTLRRALELSRNIPAVRTLAALGIEAGIEYARKLGLNGPLPPYLPIALGAGEATVMEMTAAYATFPNQGLRPVPRLITQITDRDGNVIEEIRPDAVDAIRADTAYIMTGMLRGVVESGTAKRLKKLGRPIGGKTGTTNDWTDGCFVGFEPGLAAGVWVGFDQKMYSLGRRQDGGRTALPIWQDFWQEATHDTPIDRYIVPANIVFAAIDASGKPVPKRRPGSHLEAFVAGSEPAGAYVTSDPDDSR